MYYQVFIASRRPWRIPFLNYLKTLSGAWMRPGIPASGCSIDYWVEIEESMLPNSFACKCREMSILSVSLSRWGRHLGPGP
jgi:hypothetical protein